MSSPDHLRQHIEAQLLRFAPPSLRNEGVIGFLANAARWFSIPGGNMLFNRGDRSDSLYIILSGVLGVYSDRVPGVVYRLGPGEVVGEMGSITGEPRTATVRALRSSEVLEISVDQLGRIADEHPEALLSVCRIAIQRLIQAQEGRQSRFQPRTFSLISDDPEIDLRSIVSQFATALRAHGTTFLITRDECQDMTADRLFQIETDHDYAVFLCDTDNPAWTSFCLRQSDTVIVVARGDQPSRPLPQATKTLRQGIPVALMLLWPDGRLPSGTGAWLVETGVTRHFHVRGERDLNRAIRLLIGRGFGLVLGGGGARGLAHVGVLRALREHGFEVDFVMGTSVGSLVGAGIALEWQDEQFVEQARRFARANPWLDVTVPKLSLLAGRTLRKSLLHWFGDLQIEDMPIPYSCVSTNLTSGSIAVHRTGRLETWIRASTAVPGVFPPVIFEDEVHVDGGILNNLPTDLIRANGASFVVGVDVAGNARPDDAEELLQDMASPDLRPRNVLELLWRVCSIADEAQVVSRRKQCDVLIVPELANVGLLQFRAYKWTIEQGYQTTLKKLKILATQRSDVIKAQGTAGL
jgi:NTE family protein